MELEELQSTWVQMSAKLEQQKKLTDKIILHMTQERYIKKFKHISIFETVGAMICFVVAFYILLNFQSLDTWYLILCGIFTLIFLVVLPILVLRAIYTIKYLDIFSNSYKDVLVKYLQAKKNLLLLQQLSIYMSVIQLFAVAVVFAKIWGNKDFFTVDRGIWDYVSILGAGLFIFFLARWAYSGYLKLTGSAEEILKELKDH